MARKILILLVSIVLLSACIEVNITAPEEEEFDNYANEEYEQVDEPFDEYYIPPDDDSYNDVFELPELDSGEELDGEYDYGVDWEDDGSFSIDCTPRTFEEELAVTSGGVDPDSGEGTGITVEVEIIGMNDGRCEFVELVIADKHTLGFYGKEMTCLIPEGQLSEDITDYCTGSLVDAYLDIVEVYQNE